MHRKLASVICAVLLLLVGSIAVACAAPEVLLDWSKDDGSSPYNAWLHIQREDIGGGIWHWEYWLDNGTTETLKQFSVGFLDDPTANGTHVFNVDYILGGVSTPFSQTLTTSNLLWVFVNNAVPIDGTFDSANLKTQAKFVFDTDWNYVTHANHQARDGVVTPQWVSRATPSPAIPEPMSLILGGIGMSAVAGFRKLRGR